MNYEKKQVKSVLTIAGSDCSGGAGIQADIKTITAHRLYATSVITALTAQNTTGVYDIEAVNKDFFNSQLKCVFEDIFPDAVKIGMLANESLIEVLIDNLKKYKPRNIVLDPVMVSTSEHRLLSEKAIKLLENELIPLTHLITPNLQEAQLLSKINIQEKEDMLRAAELIMKDYKGSVLIKGGHSILDSDDLLVTCDYVNWYKSEKINNNNTHGTGCTLSSAIACNLASEYALIDAVKEAKKYIKGAILYQLDMGKGNGPLYHAYNI